MTDRLPTPKSETLLRRAASGSRS